MKTGYWQIRLIDGPDGSHITAFVTERGIFRWKVMPMGIQPASNELSHQMQEVFRDLFATEMISQGSPMVRDLDDFLGGGAHGGGATRFDGEMPGAMPSGRRLLKPDQVQHRP